MLLNFCFLIVLFFIQLFNVALSKDALFLTPLIEKGEIEKARELSKVNLKEFNLTESYSGYLTVNRIECNSNLFFWFFPAVNDYKNAPVILWLNGGPGASSIHNGIFKEHGPFVLKSNNSYSYKKYHWSLYHSVIYIDNPVQVGFSFSGNKCFVTNEEEVGNDLYDALSQFFKLFSELKFNDFFVAGESYGGKYAPSISYKILRSDSETKKQINLKGIIIGNGWTDPENQVIKYGEYLQNLGLLSKRQRIVFDKLEQKAVNLISAKKFKEANDLQNLLLGDLGNLPDLYKNFTGLTSYYNILETKSETFPLIDAYLRRSDVKDAIHVGDNIFNDGQICLQYLYNDVMQSIAPWVAELLSHYRILFYNGQMDVICSYETQVNFLEKLKFNGQEEYINADRHFWYVDNELAGYIKYAGNLTDVLVRNAGHLVAFDQPKWALDLIYKFTRNIL